MGIEKRSSAILSNYLGYTKKHLPVYHGTTNDQVGLKREILRGSNGKRCLNRPTNFLSYRGTQATKHPRPMPLF